MNNTSTSEVKMQNTGKHFLGNMKNCRVIAVAIFVCLFVLLVLSVLLFIPVKRTAYVEDKYQNLSEARLASIKSAAEKLSDENNINVVIITEYIYGPLTEEEARKMANSAYREKCGSSLLVDPSGICIVLDTSSNGKAFLFGYGSARISLTKSVRSDFDKSFKSQYSNLGLAGNLNRALNQLRESQTFHATGKMTIFALCFILPFLFACVVAAFVVRAKEYAAPPTSYKYRASINPIEYKEIPVHRWTMTDDF